VHHASRAALPVSLPPREELFPMLPVGALGPKLKDFNGLALKHLKF